ncbi:hypothetical protein MD484_g667, partial [Candolleomyces efflorescens]
MFQAPIQRSGKTDLGPSLAKHNFIIVPFEAPSSSGAMETLVHLIYIHGFQGNDTSFQAFPLHLQEKLSSSVSPELNIRFQSSLYPTYKSVKPLSFATKNFLQWLTTQPDGPVIILGHSMGGLLAAEAATQLSSPKSGEHPGLRKKRVIGMIAFDTPFLGMHPHVVVSGIASLLPKGEDGDDNEHHPTEKEMNFHPAINVVSPRVTDEWEDFKSQLDPSSSSSTHSDESWKDRSPSPLFNKAVDFLASRSKEDDPVVRWLRKHAEDPLSASKRWIVERFQFGICMFDPYGLKDRYSTLVDWNGRWINYWTYTTDRVKQHHDVDSQSITSTRQAHAEQLDNDIALLDSGIYETTANISKQNTPGSTSDTEVSAPRRRKRDLLRKKQSDLEKTKAKPTKRHFVVLPTGLGRVFGGWENWEQVSILGVTDEVEAHTGLFIPQRNLDYTNFVIRVADKVLDWCKHS